MPLVTNFVVVILNVISVVAVCFGTAVAIAAKNAPVSLANTGQMSAPQRSSLRLHRSLVLLVTLLEGHQRWAQAQLGPFPSCPGAGNYSVRVLQRAVDQRQSGGSLISQANGSSVFPANFNTAWFPGNGNGVSEGLVVRVGAWVKHPEWTSSGALSIVACDFNTSVPTVDKVTAGSVVWPGVRAPKSDERWGALDPRIGYRPETQTYYLAFDNGTDSCAYRQTQLSTTSDPFNQSSWVHHGQVLAGLSAQESTAGAGFLFQPVRASQRPANQRQLPCSRLTSACMPMWSLVSRAGGRASRSSQRAATVT